jgi:hypothetical protein
MTVAIRMNSSRQIRDLFISYSSKDAEFVAKLAKNLASAGMKVWWDKMEMKVGDSLHKKIQDAISNSAWLGIVLSPHSVSSQWVEKELTAGLTRELEMKEVFVLPILYKDCEIPLFLKDKVYADFRNSFNSGFEVLLNRIDAPIKPAIMDRLMSGMPSKISASFARIETQNRKIYLDDLIAKLASSSVGEKTAALTALFVIRDKDLSGHLLRMAKDSSSSVRRFAVFYLGELRARYSISVVSELLSDKSQEVRAAARDAYRKINGTRA